MSLTLMWGCIVWLTATVVYFGVACHVLKNRMLYSRGCLVCGWWWGRYMGQIYFVCVLIKWYFLWGFLWLWMDTMEVYQCLSLCRWYGYSSMRLYSMGFDGIVMMVCIFACLVLREFLFGWIRRLLWCCGVVVSFSSHSCPVDCHCGNFEPL